MKSFVKCIFTKNILHIVKLKKKKKKGKLYPLTVVITDLIL